MSDYPEHDKLAAIADQSHVCGEFYDWLQGQGYRLCTIPDGYDHSYFPTNAFIEDLLAQFFKIDQQKIELEKRAMLDKIRELNQ